MGQAFLSPLGILNDWRPEPCDPPTGFRWGLVALTDDAPPPSIWWIKWRDVATGQEGSMRADTVSSYATCAEEAFMVADHLNTRNSGRFHWATTCLIEV